MAKRHVMSGSGCCSMENLGSLSLSAFCGVIIPVCKSVHTYVCVCIYVCKFTVYPNTLEVT